MCPWIVRTHSVIGEQGNPPVGLDQQCAKPSWDFHCAATGIQRYPGWFRASPFKTGVVVAAVVILITHCTVGAWQGVVLTDGRTVASSQWACRSQQWPS